MTLRKSINRLKKKLEAQIKILNRVKEEYSTKCVHYRFAKEKIANLTIKLDALKAKFKDADFNFKKFDVSSEIVELMIKKQLNWKDK